jgi:hypothetical protein
VPAIARRQATVGREIDCEEATAVKPPRRRTSKDTPSKLAKRVSRRWRVVLLRAKGEILGQVEAPDAQAAKAAAAVQFELDDIQRNRIIVQEEVHRSHL